MLSELSGKAAFITGGSSGIGLGLAQVLAEHGMKLAIGYRSESHRDEALKLFTPDQIIIPVEVDIADRASLDHAAEQVRGHFGKLHLLACNAGVFLPASLAETSHADWDWEIGVNLTGTFNTVKAFVPQLLEHGEPAHIAATGSILGLLGSAAAPAYSASKFGVTGLLESLAAELRDTNVGVTIFSPGFVNTNVADWRRNRADSGARSGGRDVNPAVWTDPDLTMDPVTAARHLLTAIQSGQLHAIPNWEYQPALAARAAMIERGIAAKTTSTQAREAFGQSFLDRSIYASESTSKLAVDPQMKNAH